MQGPEPVLREQAGLLRNGYDVVAHGGVGDEHDGRGDEQRADGARSVGRADGEPGRGSLPEPRLAFPMGLARHKPLGTVRHAPGA